MAETEGVGRNGPKMAAPTANMCALWTASMGALYTADRGAPYTASVGAPVLSLVCSWAAPGLLLGCS